ncbi:hypothetical protein [Alteromonas sp. CYL-A6]|uniref:hypothetical protein n=1 Tax=Alteromonas nitratireducens TaxID=3390813 RepID=UPI0034AA62C0
MAINVYIHVGPPKTGTSAIQNWLQANNQVLLEHGIYYPAHAMDENGVSSGNLLALFDRDDDKNLTFNVSKATSVLKDAQARGASALLLSSEFFFKRLTPVLDFFPGARVIAYLRDPLEVIESGYNQGVKRHYQTKKLKVAKAPRTPTLDLLAEQVRQFGADSFILRPYDFSLFHGGDLVSDFLSVFSLAKLHESQSPIINSSYVFEAMEFKRWFNHIQHQPLHRALDRFLQGYTAGTAKYSLLSAKKRTALRAFFNKRLKTFVDEFAVPEGEQFIEALNSKAPKPYKKQEIRESEFEALLLEFLDASESVVVHLLNIYKDPVPDSLQQSAYYPTFEKVMAAYDKKYKKRLKWQKLRSVGSKLLPKSW